MKKTIVSLLLLTSSMAMAQMSHNPNMHKQAPAAVAQPQQPGQSTFGAISEIVQLLQNAPKTDWSKVNITALRNHLIDMDDVFVQTNAEMTFDENSMSFKITGKGKVIEAIKRMVPAHAAMMQGDTGWQIVTTPNADGVDLKITPKNKGDIVKIKALGFYGFLSMGNHHQPHHLMMARGMHH